MLRYHTIPVTPFQQNCSLLICPATNRAAFVDPGGEVDRLFELLAKQYELARIDEAREGALIQVVDPATKPE